jgi:type IV pilus assembly protein PilA
MTNELILNSNNIGVNTTRKSLTKKKKKGFTLVELIAVIAILAILAAIIVPRVASYTGKATEAKHLANAKTIANAVEAYNADSANTAFTDADTLADIKDKLMPNYIQTWPNNAEITAISPVATGVTVGTYGALKAYITAHSGN